MPSRRQVLSGLGTATVATLAGCFNDDGTTFSPGTDSDADWPMARYDASNTAYNPDAIAPRDGVQERWTVESGMATGPPAVVDGTVFLPTAEALLALDATTGAEQWRFAPAHQPWPSAPVVHDGVVYVTAIDEDSIHALDAASGTERWALTDVGHVHLAPHLIAGEHISDPVIYTGTEHGELLRLDPATGDVTWQTDLFGTISAIGYRLPGLYVGTSGGEIYTFADSIDGVERPKEGWHRKVGSAVEAILPDEECVLVHTFGGPLQCLGDGAHAGTTRWTIDEKWANSAPVHAGYTFFAAGYEGLVAAREYDKEARWRVRGRYDATGPVAAGDTLYVSSGEAVHAVALEGGVGVGSVRIGAHRWSHPTPAEAVEGLAVADGAVFAACEGRTADTTLYCLEPD